MDSNASQFNRDLFDVRASRYCAALAAAPHARLLELTPLLPLLAACVKADPGTLTAIDHLCGQGHLSTFLRPTFKQIIGVDQSEGMLRHYPRVPGLRCVQAEAGELARVMATEASARVVVTLAGMHHLFATLDGRVDGPASDDLQARMLVDWAKALPDDGALILLDVTGRYAPVGPLGPDLPVDSGGAFRQRFEALRDESPAVSGDWPATVDEFVARQATTYAEFGGCSPAGWFEDVVCDIGEHGHVAHFPEPVSLHAGLLRAGFRATYREILTPWFFSDDGKALEFFRALFGLRARDGAHSVTDDRVRDGIRRHLGWRTRPDGSVVTGWRLGYHVVTEG